MKKMSAKVRKNLDKEGLLAPEGGVVHITAEQMNKAEGITDKINIRKEATQIAMEKSLVALALEDGGSIHPLLIDPKQSGGLGLCNASIFKDEGEDNYLINVRNVSYTLHHADGDQKYQTPWGPLNYVRPDNDAKLRTWNYVGQLDKNGKSIAGVKFAFQVDTAKFKKKPKWTFVGLEDARIVRWDKKLYIIGCRRDIKEDGESRMEMSEIELLEDGVKEVNRHRINAPVDKDSYCEKNWMPVLDMPNHFVKWVNPTEVVEAYPRTEGYKNSSEVVFQADDSTIIDLPFSPRGGSQVVPYGDYRIACVHDVEFWHNEKNDRDARYWHRFVVWDKDWNVVTISRQWKFMDGRIEFCCGMALDGDDLLLTFGFQDNSAYLVRVPQKTFETALGRTLL